MLAQRIPKYTGDAATDLEAVCSFSQKWTISFELGKRLFKMQQESPYGLRIISGYRTPEQQAQLRQEGRPAADDDKSTHLSCPATGADLDFLGLHPTDTLKAQFGMYAQLAGLRVGGGGPVNPDTGVPLDWNHVDLGPRQPGS